MKNRLTVSVLVVLLAVFLCAGYSAAQYVVKPQDSDKWKQSFTLYLWLPAMDGDITVRGNPASVDTSVSDAWDALSSLDGAFTGHYEASKDRWTILADLFYIRIKDNATSPMGNPFTYEPSQMLAELGAAYLVNKHVDSRCLSRTVEVLGGFRYNDVRLRLTDTLGNSTAGDQEWLDPFIGARYKQDISDRWAWGIRGDIGGFGIGDASDFAWNVILAFEYDLSRLWGLYTGWRWYDVDYDTGSGASRFEYDVLANGPFLGVQYRW